MIYGRKLTFWEENPLMNGNLYHQIENTTYSEFSTRVCGADNPECELFHFHKNFELLIVMQGTCACTVGGEEYAISEGDCILVCPFQIHSFRPGADSFVRRVTFHEHLILTLAQNLDERRPQNPVFRPAPMLTEFFLRQMDRFFGEDSGSFTRIAPHHTRMQVKGCLYTLGGEFLGQVNLMPRKSADAVTMAVVQFISENYRKDISLRDAARETGYNYQYLSRTFNRIIGINFKKMLNQYRLEHAHALLQDTKLPIGDIAFESGFQSIRSFDQICLEHFGKSPKELRQERKRGSAPAEGEG